MRALITGITGFAGSHLAQILLDRGDKVAGVARSHTKRLDYLSQSIEPIIADLRDPNAVDQLISDVQPDAIYHLAGQ
ncbi:MAG TPA: GDP-mannose 4,6-dehydratase, partial [Anaerolineae bacterium]|nr:GDP-mannose 4,6-dehydratase [Anaerolineae bacterium]